ncbi:transposase [Streptomyces sp. NPDC020192]|uniref:transposase n=1 Tax=Streptomyces sp. NPDC020192 TaxID=3365066 RepID=UPI003793F043
MKSLAAELSADAVLGVLSHFRVEFCDCLYTRADALFELTDAVLCSDGPVTSLVELTLTAEHRRGHGAMYDAVNHGWLEPRRLRRLLASTPLPRAADGRIVLAMDVSNWLRPDAPTGVAVLPRLRAGPQRGSGRPRLALLLRRRPGDGTHVLDAIRLGPSDDAALVTATRLREVVTRLVHAGQWRPGDADILVVMDTGYDVTRLAYVLAGLPVELVGRLRSDRVMLRDAGPRRSTPCGGQPRRHGGVLTFSKPESWHAPDQATTCDTARCGTAEALAWDRFVGGVLRRGVRHQPRAGIPAPGRRSRPGCDPRRGHRR